MTDWYINDAEFFEIRKKDVDQQFFTIFSDFRALCAVYVPTSHVLTLLDPTLLVLNLIKTLLSTLLENHLQVINIYHTARFGCNWSVRF